MSGYVRFIKFILSTVLALGFGFNVFSTNSLVMRVVLTVAWSLIAGLEVCQLYQVRKA